MNLKRYIIKYENVAIFLEKRILILIVNCYVIRVTYESCDEIDGGYIACYLCIIIRNVEKFFICELFIWRGRII